MLISEFKDFVLAISGSVSMIAVSVGVWFALREYRIKLQAEARLQRSGEIESEIRLQTLFVELLKIANGRSGYQVSEKTAEFVLQHVSDRVGKSSSIADLHKAVEDAAIITLPVGAASQDAAVAAIAALALRHHVLEKPALRALESLSAGAEVPKHLIDSLVSLKSELGKRVKI